MSDTQKQSNTVIIGAGIIGCSTAYYLSTSASPSRIPPSSIHIIEASPQLFASASGYAGGFLARDWFGPAVASLGALSFDLHKQLAEEHDGRKKWGYITSTGTSLTQEPHTGARGDDWLRDGGSRAEQAGTHEFVEGSGPAWLTRRNGARVEVISEDETTAQVDPLRLSRFLLESSMQRGVKLHQPATAVMVSKGMDGQLSSICIRKEDGSKMDLPVSRIIITSGAWSRQVFDTLFPATKVKIPISQLAGHSVVVRSPRWAAEHEIAGCHAVFSSDSDGFSPEIFSRIGSEIYVAGLNDSSIPLPKLPTDSRPDPRCIKRLVDVSKKMLGLQTGEDDLQILREGLCFRPVTNRGTPFITRISDEKLGGGISTCGGGQGGVFFAAGHGPWGISHSLGTGKVLSELVEGMPLSASIKALSL